MSHSVIRSQWMTDLKKVERLQSQSVDETSGQTIQHWSATDQSFLENHCNQSESKSVAAILLSMLKRLATTSFDQTDRPCCNLYKILPRLLQPHCDTSLVTEVSPLSQALMFIPRQKQVSDRAYKTIL